MRRHQCSLAGLIEACGEFGKITSFAEELATRIHHFDVHLQVVVEPGGGFGPGFVRHTGAGHAQKFAAQCLRQRADAEGDLTQRRTDEIRHRHEVLADRLGQVAHQRYGLGLDQARHQPVEPLGAQLRQQRRRHAQGHAIARVVGLEVVFQRQLQLADAQGVGVLRGSDFASIAGQHVFLAHDQ